MRKLGEQWIEEIDGKKHMLKAVNYSEGCNGCIFLRYDPDEFYTCNRGRLGCPVDDGMIIKDLGPVNEDGVLAEERTGLFPVIAGIDSEKCWIVRLNAGNVTITAIGNTKQESIDAWNRRA